MWATVSLAQWHTPIDIGDNSTEFQFYRSIQVRSGCSRGNTIGSGSIYWIANDYTISNGDDVYVERMINQI